jgi:hypothetical protein
LEYADSADFILDYACQFSGEMPNQVKGMTVIRSIPLVFIVFHDEKPP